MAFIYYLLVGMSLLSFREIANYLVILNTFMLFSVFGG
jgi:hypothetical protein